MFLQIHFPRKLLMGVWVKSRFQLPNLVAVGIAVGGLALSLPGRKLRPKMTVAEAGVLARWRSEGIKLGGAALSQAVT